MIKCPECGVDVSDRAPTCPSCGVRDPGGVNMLTNKDGQNPSHQILLIVILIVIFGSLVFAASMFGKILFP